MNVLLILLCYSVAYAPDKKEVAADQRDVVARRIGSAKDVAAHKSAILSSSSTKKVADHRIQGEGQRSSPTTAVAVYRRKGQKTQSVHLSSSSKTVGNYRRDGSAQGNVSEKIFGFKQKVPLDSIQKRDYRAPVTNVSKATSISFTTEKSQRRRFARTLKSKTTKKMLRRVIFTTARVDGLPQQTGPNASKKVRFIMPTRIGRYGNLEIVSPTTPMPTFDPLKPIGRSWRATRSDVSIQAVNIMTQIVYAAQGQNIGRVERVAEKYRHDTRYRMAFILLKLDLICTEMTRKQTFIIHKLYWNTYVNRYRWLQRTYPVRKVLAFYTDMLRQNIDVTYAVEYLFRLYKEKALERQSAREGKAAREKMRQAAAMASG